jgi:hypothetical protein
MHDEMERNGHGSIDVRSHSLEGKGIKSRAIPVTGREGS